jgi:hypothetical protein
VNEVVLEVLDEMVTSAGGERVTDVTVLVGRRRAEYSKQAHWALPSITIEFNTPEKVGGVEEEVPDLTHLYILVSKVERIIISSRKY